MAQLGFTFEPPPRTLDLAALCDGDERDVAAALRWGRKNARQVPELATATGIPGRRVQEIVQHLILGHQVPVGTSMSAPAGNYLISDPEDLARTEELLRRRAIQTLVRAAALRRMEVRRYLEFIQPDLLAQEDR